MMAPEDHLFIAPREKVMTENNRQSNEAVAQAVLDDPTHYIGSVATMAAKNELNAAQDILSASGIKLVAGGTRIDAGLQEKLRGHRFSGAGLETGLSIAGAVSPVSLATDIGRLIDADAWHARLTAKSGDPGALRHAVAHLKLPQEILFRLTVARDQRPDLYQHSLSVAIIGHYLALRSSLGTARIDNVLIAALCHDLGELHIDPSILESGHRVSDQERRFIYVHPIIGWLMVRDLPGMNAEVASAILEHQERLDGSGYPHGRTADQLGLPGRILAAADVSASIMARFGDNRRLSTLLRLNGNKYDAKIITLLHEAIVEDTEPPVHSEHGSLVRRLTGFVSLLDSWAKLRAAAESAQAIHGDFLADRMFNLRTAIIRCGFDPDSLDMPLKLAEEDSTIAAELTNVVDELQFQLADLGREFDRRTEELTASLAPHLVTALTEWRAQLKACIENR